MAKERIIHSHTNEKTWQKRGTSVTNAWHGCITHLKTCQGVLAGFTSTSMNMPKGVGRFS